MIVTRLCPVTGATISRDVPCTQRQLTAWEMGELIQNAMPDVPRVEREYVLTGMTPEVWAQHCGVEHHEGVDEAPLVRH